MVEFKNLPYAADALEPVLSQKTLETHYGKHHRKYYDNLVQLVKGTRYEQMSLVDIIRNTENPVVFNNAAQVYNHDFLWRSMTDQESLRKVSDNLSQAIEHTYTTFDNFKQTFIDKATKHFGSGWVWLVRAEDEIEIWTTHDADTPVKQEAVTPLMCMDLWEHAYYVDYLNDRKTYLEKVFEIINWEFANQNLVDSM